MSSLYCARRGETKKVRGGKEGMPVKGMMEGNNGERMMEGNDGEGTDGRE